LQKILAVVKCARRINQEQGDEVSLQIFNGMIQACRSKKTDRKSVGMSL